MDFTDVVNDLIKLEGLSLHSIRPGADIVIEKVDIDQKRLTIRNASGKTQNRYFVELERIWEALLASPAIRVEDVLNGSGSSRNQPETIFANLPYIEWLKIDNKKHIAYVRSSTHAYGTNQQMNSAVSSRLGDQLVDVALREDTPLTLVVAADVAHTSQHIVSLLGKKPIAVSEGIYEFVLKSGRIVLAGTDKLGVPSGTYIEIKSSFLQISDCTINIGGHKWNVYVNEELKLISRL